MTELNIRIKSLYKVPFFQARNELELTPQAVAQLIEKHRSYQTRYDLLFDYYIGKHSIQNRVVESNKPNNKLIDNFAEYITNVKTGYFMGNPVRYAMEDEEILEIIRGILDYNDEQDNNSELAKLMSIYGHAFELMYIDDDGKLRFRYISPKQMFMVYGMDIEETPIGAVRYYTVGSGQDAVTYAELYLENKIVYLKGEHDSDYVVEREVDHQFSDVPVTEYTNNDERLGDFESVITLIDAYEVVMADSVNEVQYFNDAYLVIRNLMMTDKEDLQDMKNNRIIQLDEDGEASWLIKNINDTHVQNVLDRIQTDIHRFSKTPNLTDENFASNLSGVAIRFKLWGLEQDAINKERKFKKGLQRRFELISNFIGKVYKTPFNWLDLKVIFTRNIPTNVLEQSQIVANLNGVVSRQTLLSVLPFVEDPLEEIRLLEAEDELQLDQFGFTNTGMANPIKDENDDDTGEEE